MSKLEKAKLAVVTNDTAGAAEDVQFNPTSLKIQRTNTLSQDKSASQHTTQYMGTSAAIMTLDLIFDTADEGTSENPKSVLERTAVVDKFVVPKGKPGENQTVPRVEFQWGTLVFRGIMQSVNTDIDHFASNGTPLRAKVAISIKEQDEKYETLKSGPGANGVEGGAPAAGGLGLGIGGSAGLSLGGGGIGFGAVGSVGIGLDVSAQAGLAIGGESAAGFAARVGVDVEAWRGLSLGSQNPLSLSAGVEIGFSANLSASVGLGVSAGFSAGVSASLDASFGLSGAGSAQAGFAVAAAGGVSSAIATVQTNENRAQQANAKQAFALPASTPAPPRPGLPEQMRTPLTLTGLLPAWHESPANPPPPRVDPRESSFGNGLPLRTSVGPALESRNSVVQGAVPLRNNQPDTGEPPTTTDRTVPSWVALPVPNTSESAKKKKPCGCGGRCRCTCGG